MRYRFRHLIQPTDEPGLIETGDKLGDITSELRATQFVSEFVSVGSKNYAYKVIDTVTVRATTVCKVRGINLSYSAKQLVNFDDTRDMVLGTSAEPTVTVHTEKKIKRKRKGELGIVAIVTEPADKTYRISFFKRLSLADNSSVPFGYKYFE